MSGESAGPKLLKCFQCDQLKAEDDYSKTQLKLKGKRVCKPCAAANSAAPAAPSSALDEKDVIHTFTNAEGAVTVKQVLADDIKRAQEKGGKTSAPLPMADKYQTLLKWLADGKAKFKDLELKYYTVDYRGVHAKNRMEKDQIILEVPLNLIMTSDKARESNIGQRIHSSGCQLRSSHSWLACMLLEEKAKGDKSFYYPYIATLPQHYRNMPTFFDEEEKKELKGSFTLKMIADRKVSIQNEYDNICAHIPEFKRKYHVLSFEWARLAVITRIFGFEVGTHKTDGLVAMADMLNHKRPNETSWHFDNSLGAFTITTTKQLLKVRFLIVDAV